MGPTRSGRDLILHRLPQEFTTGDGRYLAVQSVTLDDIEALEEYVARINEAANPRPQTPLGPWWVHFISDGGEEEHLPAQWSLAAVVTTNGILTAAIEMVGGGPIPPGPLLARRGIPWHMLKALTDALVALPEPMREANWRSHGRGEMQ